MPEESAEEERKRHRNRMAQQKYRKKLKSRIKDLERRAARAADYDEPPSPRTNDEMIAFGGRRARYSPDDEAASSSLTSGAVSSAMSISAATNAISPFAKLVQPVHAHQEDSSIPAKGVDMMLPRTAHSSLTDDFDFLKGFSLSEDASWANQNTPPAFHEIWDAEMHSDVSKPENFTSRQDFSENSAKSSLPATSQASSGWSPSLLRQPAAQDRTNQESRVERILQNIQANGFDSPDAFVSCYYTAPFSETSTAKMAQETSRRKGLPHFLEELKTQESLWSPWESSGYRDAILRSAADLVSREFERLARKKYACETELQQMLSTTAQVSAGSGSSGDVSPAKDKMQCVAAELKSTLGDEMPNLNTFITTFSARDAASMSRSNKMRQLVATIRMITSSRNDPLQEAADWVYIRSNPLLPTPYTTLSYDDFDGGSGENAPGVELGLS